MRQTLYSLDHRARVRTWCAFRCFSGTVLTLRLQSQPWKPSFTLCSIDELLSVLARGWPYFSLPRGPPQAAAPHSELSCCAPISLSPTLIFILKIRARLSLPWDASSVFLCRLYVSSLCSPRLCCKALQNPIVTVFWRDLWLLSLSPQLGMSQALSPMSGKLVLSTFVVNT